MAACGSCGTTVLFGGATIGQTRYCNAKCAQRGQILAYSQQLAPDVVHDSVSRVHRGACPRCQGPGPVDVHTSYRVWSALVVTQWQSLTHVACRSCGRKSQIGDGLLSLLLGWWGFPWGLVMTPVQIARNIAGLMKSPSENGPSPKLETAVRVALASNAMSRR
jgi:hypothetical protein